MVFPYTTVLCSPTCENLLHTLLSSPGCLRFVWSLVFNSVNFVWKPKDKILKLNFRNRLPTSKETEMQCGGAMENSLILVWSCSCWHAKLLKLRPWLLYQRLAKCYRHKTGNHGMASCPLHAHFDISLPDYKIFSWFSSEIILKLTSWGGVTSVVVGQLWTSVCPFPFLSFLNLCNKIPHLIET